jgi:hypothetical protein
MSRNDNGQSKTCLDDDSFKQIKLQNTVDEHWGQGKVGILGVESILLFSAWLFPECKKHLF